jgi:hypothetical protein
MQAQPPQKKGMSVLAIVLIVLGTLLLLGVGTCVAGAFWLKGKAEGALGELADGGGIVLASPPAVKAELAGPRKAYVGSWHGSGGDLIIDADGNLKFDKHKASGMKESLNAPIAAFVGNDIEIRVLVRMVVKVTPPHKVGDHWEMTADGVTLERK